jgi:hypothetical protein
VSSKWSPSLTFSHRNPVYTSLIRHTCYMPRQWLCSVILPILFIGFGWAFHLSGSESYNMWWGQVLARRHFFTSLYFGMGHDLDLKLKLRQNI